jgi:tight adherence protein B
MQFFLAALTFLIVTSLLVAAFALAGGARQENVVRARLEAIEKGARRRTSSQELELVRDESLSDVPVFHRLLSRWSWSAGLRALVAQAGLNFKLGKLFFLSGVLALGAYAVVHFFYRNPIFSLLAAVGGALLPITAVAIKRSKRMRAFEKGFPDAIDLLVRAVRAGHSFTTGLEMIGTELAEPVSGEFRITFDEQSFGLPLRDALLNMTKRVPIIDVRFFVTALLIQKETGGNLAEVLDNLSHVIRDRFRLLGEVRIRTAQGRLTAAILIALPPVMLVLMRTMNPGYARLLFEDPWGPYMLGAAALLQVIGAIALWKIVNIEV